MESNDGPEIPDGGGGGGHQEPSAPFQGERGQPTDRQKGRQNEALVVDVQYAGEEERD